MWCDRDVSSWVRAVVLSCIRALVLWVETLPTLQLNDVTKAEKHESTSTGKTFWLSFHLKR